MAALSSPLTPTTTSYGSIPSISRGQFHKKKRCRDFLFALAFTAHGIVVTCVWVNHKAPPAAQDWAGRGVYQFVGITALLSLLLSTVALFFMLKFADKVVEIGLVGSLLLTGFVTGWGIHVGKVWLVVVGGLSLIFGAVWIDRMRQKVSFAPTNFKIAIKIIRTNLGLVIIGYALEGVAFLWTVVWMDSCGAAMNSRGVWIVLVYLVSFVWAQQAISNLQQVIVASMLGIWWHNLTDSPCWDEGLNRALCHSCTYSFGSVCFGSLLAGAMTPLKWLHRMRPRNATTKCGVCIAAMIGKCLARDVDMLESFNKWTFAYIGIHGESYLKSGRKVLELFDKRRWSAIIADGLADGVMLMLKWSISLMSGFAGWCLVTYDRDIFVGLGISAENDDTIGFIAGAMIGYTVGCIMMELVSSTMNAVIVCFAEAPAELQQNQETLCDEMVEAWKNAYPDEYAHDPEVES